MMKDDRYSIIVSSETDARKKAASFSITRRRLIVLLSVIVFVLLACIGFAVKSVADTASYSKELKALEQSLEKADSDVLPAE